MCSRRTFGTPLSSALSRLAGVEVLWGHTEAYRLKGCTPSEINEVVGIIFNLLMDGKWGTFHGGGPEGDRPHGTRRL